MRTINLQLKALVLLLVFILGYTVVERVDTVIVADSVQRATASVISDFLGIITNSSESDTETVTESTTGELIDELGSILINTPAPLATIVTTTSSSNLNERTPTLICLPEIVGANETVIVMWACRDGAYTTTSDTIDTAGETIGSVRMQPSANATYDITCVNDITDVADTAATCSIDVAQPSIAIIATPDRVDYNESTSLSWRTTDATACAVTSDTNSSFERRGVAGDISSHSLTRDTTFTLTCETITGLLEKKEIEVSVRN